MWRVCFTHPHKFKLIKENFSIYNIVFDSLMLELYLKNKLSAYFSLYQTYSDIILC